MKSFQDFNARGLDVGGSDLLGPGTHRVRIDKCEFDPVAVMVKMRLKNDAGAAFLNLRLDESKPKQQEFNLKRMKKIATILDHPTPDDFADKGVEWYEGKELVVALKENEYSKYPEVSDISSVPTQTSKTAAEQFDDDIPF